MKKFEYRVLVADGTLQENPPNLAQLLNQEEHLEWELVGCTREQYPTNPQQNNQVMLVLKRLIR